MTRTMPIDPAKFRTTLGHYPTGVVLVTGIDADGDPVGMVVGSFTSVSLDPPLIAFLPTRDSGRWKQLQMARSFCVNVLAHDQGDLCRAFAGRGGNDFTQVAWSPSPSGAPVLDGAVAWLDCTIESIVEGGDHDIVLSRVNDLDVVRPVAPLLFFQGGYGRFSLLSLVVPQQADLVSAVRLAELARPEMEGLVADVPVEATAQVAVGEDMVVVAAQLGPGAQASTTLGVRVPLRPPLGEPFIAWQEQEAAERWLQRIVALDPCTRERYVERLRLTRERGYAMSLVGLDQLGHPSGPLMIQLLDEYTAGELTPVRERELLAALAQASMLYEPQQLRPDGCYDVGTLIVPVFGRDGRVQLMLRLAQLPPGQTGKQVQGWVDRLRAAADVVGHRLSAEAA